MGNTCRLEIEGQSLELLPERVLYWPAGKLLAAADLHWGKCATFQRHGIPIPTTVLREDLARLGRVIERTKVDEVLILGDLIHHHSAIEAPIADLIGEWRRNFSRVRMTLIEGNHDRQVEQFLEQWSIDLHTGPILTRGPFSFSHEPNKADQYYNFAGHVHPMATVKGAGDQVRLPCFSMGPKHALLPAFSYFTGGVEVSRGKDARIFCLTDAKVIELPQGL